ncbi:MAG: DUF1573 domain-containing protein [Planctomycetaceae bacterium]|nr:DUF1573 domain-containing protein [Planctomycetaceae bacterium]
MKSYKLKSKSNLVLVIVFIVSILVVAIMSWKCGGFFQFVAYLDGKTIYIEPHVCDLGECEADSNSEAVFSLTNLTSKLITIVGAGSSCNCAVVDRLPLDIQSGNTINVKIVIRLPKEASAYDQIVTLLVAEKGYVSKYPVRVKATTSNSKPLPN